MILIILLTITWSGLITLAALAHAASGHSPIRVIRVIRG